MDIASILRKAADSVNEAALSPELRPYGFVKAVELLSRGEAEQVHARARRVDGGGQGPDQNERGDWLSQVSARLGVDAEQVAEVFDDDGGDLRLIVAASKLPNNKSGASKMIALLVAAGRQAAGRDADGWTDSSVIRDACRDYGRLDGANFSTTLSAMRDEFSFKGKGPQRQVRLTRPGFDLAARLVTQLTRNEGP